MARCTYRYADDEQCMSNVNKGNKMCSAHTLISERAKSKAKNDAKRYERTKRTRPSRAKPKVEEHIIKSTVIDDNLYDHTAPYACSLKDCPTCKDKPSLAEWIHRNDKKR